MEQEKKAYRFALATVPRRFTGKSRKLLLLLALAWAAGASAIPPVWGYRIAQGPTAYRLFPDAGSVASFGCSNITNITSSSVDSIAQNGNRLIVNCRFETLSGLELSGSAGDIVWTMVCPPGSVFDGSDCAGHDDNKKKPCPDPSSGNPIQSLTGVKLHREVDVDDMGAKLAAGLVFSRVFDSRTTYALSGALGPHWRHNFESRLRFLFRPLVGINEPLYLGSCDSEYHVDLSTGAFATQGSCGAQAMQSSSFIELYAAVLDRPGIGSTYFYLQDGEWHSEADTGEQLVLHNEGEFIGWRYSDGSGLVELYSDRGRLARREEQGISVSLEYALPAEQGGDGDTATLDRAEASNGSVLEFSHEEGLLVAVQVSGETSGETLYRYRYTEPDTATGERLLQHVEYPDLSTNTSGDNPWGADNPYRTYHYENPVYRHYLTGITDESRVRIVSWDYDSARRANRSSTTTVPGEAQQTVTIDYNKLHITNQPHVIETNAYGKQTAYYFDASDGRRLLSRIEGRPHEQEPGLGCAASARHYDYDNAGRLTRSTDWEGNVTLYDRDLRGREIRRTEGLRWLDDEIGGQLLGYENSRLVSTYWHPRWNKLIRRADPVLVSDWSYDCASGRLLGHSKYPRGSEPPLSLPPC